jgi:hypothetical protein
MKSIHNFSLSRHLNLISTHTFSQHTCLAAARKLHASSYFRRGGGMQKLLLTGRDLGQRRDEIVHGQYRLSRTAPGLRSASELIRYRNPHDVAEVAGCCAGLTLKESLHADANLDHPVGSERVCGCSSKSVLHHHSFDPAAKLGTRLQRASDPTVRVSHRRKIESFAGCLTCQSLHFLHSTGAFRCLLFAVACHGQRLGQERLRHLRRSTR